MGWKSLKTVLIIKFKAGKLFSLCTKTKVYWLFKSQKQSDGERFSYRTLESLASQLSSDAHLTFLKQDGFLKDWSFYLTGIISKTKNHSLQIVDLENFLNAVCSVIDGKILEDRIQNSSCTDKILLLWKPSDIVSNLRLKQTILITFYCIRKILFKLEKD